MDKVDNVHDSECEAYDRTCGCESRQTLKAENAALLNQMQEMVRLAAEKNKPAYDEQQRVIMELREENAALKASVAHLESLIADIATVAGRDTPDAIDNDGQPYQSAALAAVMERAKR
jgi:BMFP domain-containing protein YqiC